MKRLGYATGSFSLFYVVFCPVQCEVFYISVIALALLTEVRKSIRLLKLCVNTTL